MKQPRKDANMDINRTSGKRVSAPQRDSFTAQNNQATICKPWNSLAAVAFGLFLSVPGLMEAQYQFSTIDVPGAIGTAANGNSTNAIAGEADDANGNPLYGFVLKNGSFTFIRVPTAAATSVNGINAPSQLVGTYVDNGGTVHAFFENNGVFTTLDPVVPSVHSQGGSINAKGQVVGSYRDQSQIRHGFIWFNGTFTSFNVPGDEEGPSPNVGGTVALGINDSGAVVGDYVDDTNHNRHGFLRSSKGAFTTLDVPGAVLTVAEGINNPGTIVGVYVAADGTVHGFVSNNGVDFTQVDVPNAQETRIFSINAKSEIVGRFIDSQGTHGFLGVPVP
jgi:uncharacterized membrane protein